VKDQASIVSYALALQSAAAEGTACVRLEPDARPAPRNLRTLPLLDVPTAPYRPAKDDGAPRGAIDCASRLPLCRARCCHFAVVLLERDVREGAVRSDPDDPFRIERRSDRSCVHLVDRECSIYERRPTVCRLYDCRKDSRIWLDFDARIPAR
jgi:hypothetical protein